MSQGETAATPVLTVQDGDQDEGGRSGRRQDGRPDLRDEPGTEIRAPAWAQRLADRGRRLRHRVARLPWWVVLALRIAVLAVRGTRTTTLRWWRWVTVEELTKAMREPNSDTLKVFERRSSVRWYRLGLTAAGLVLVAALAALALFSLGLARAAPVLAAPAAAGAALAGRKEGERIAGPRRPGRVSQDVVNEALRAAGVIKPGASVQFVTPIAKDGAAWTALVDLPPGTKADTAIRAKEAIASALAVDEVQLDLSRVRGPGGHAGRLSIWCAGSDPYARKPEPWPLADAAEWDFWQAFPFGRDARGREVPLAMLWTHLLVGSIPRIGKTFSARLVASAAALDPYVRMVVFDGKGGTDWKPFAHVAWRWGKGVRPAAVERLAAVLAGLVEEMNDRYDRLGGLPAEDVPEGKIAPGISRDPDAGMPLVLVVVDEVHRYLDDKEHGDAILEALVELAKVGPAVGIMLVLATQKPDADTIPSELRDVLGTRFALKTMTWQASETILGAGTYKAGLDASKFLRSHKGVGILLGADDESATEEPVTIRSYLLDAVGVRAVCERGRRLRIDAGTLEGDAAGDTDPAGGPVETDVLGLVRDVFGDADMLRSVEVCDRLKAAGLDVTPQRLAALLAPHGVHPGDIWVGKPPKSVKGYRSRDLLAALERRTRGARDRDVP